MARTLIASDAFATEGALGSPNWTQLNVNDAGNVQVSAGGTISGSVYGQDAVARWSGAGSFTSDQCSSLVVSGLSGTGAYGIGVIARASGDVNAARDFYWALLADITYFGKVVNGTSTQFTSSATPTWSNGDRLELECEGTTIRVMKNGVALGGAFTVTDSDIATGTPGVLGRGDPGVISGDLWEGSNLASASPAAIFLYHLRQQGIA